jgi:EAL domain-containing protein (putative c-di-GMP-specific phosphodiesterase class I)
MCGGVFMLIDTLLQPGNIAAVFQPIVRLRDDGPRLHSLECLSRGKHGSHFESAEVMFEYVRCMAAEPRMDLRCIETALQAATTLPRGIRLSLNVHTATLARLATFPFDLEKLLHASNISPKRIVVEITEHAVPWITRRFHEALEYIRELGVAIALDDVGAGHANFKMIVDVRPDVLKIDRCLVHGVATDRWRQAMIESIVRVGHSFDVDVVAEGVSAQADLGVLRSLGIVLAQGFLFARPSPASELVRHPLLQLEPVT